MPQKNDRDVDEAAIAGGLSELFANTRSDLDRGIRVNWGDFQSKASAVIKPTLEEVFAVVFVLLIMQEGTASGAALWAAQQTAAVATRLTRNIRSQIASGVTPERALTNGRASSLAATEVTRAVSSGERAARVANATAAPVEGGRQPGLTNPLAIRDGVVAHWETEDDELVCPICGPLDGKREEVWIREFPMGPPAHPNCRCWLSYKPRSQ